MLNITHIDFNFNFNFIYISIVDLVKSTYDKSILT